MADCVFCSPIDHALYDDGRVAVVSHEDRAVRGHAMVVARRHVENASDLPTQEWLHFARVQHAAEHALLEATGAERAVLLKLGIQTPHLHVHIYPVRASLTRAEVQEIIDGRVREDVEYGFDEGVRVRIAGLMDQRQI